MNVCIYYAYGIYELSGKNGVVSLEAEISRRY